MDLKRDIFKFWTYTAIFTLLLVRQAEPWKSLLRNLHGAFFECLHIFYQKIILFGLYILKFWNTSIHNQISWYNA